VSAIVSQAVARKGVLMEEKLKYWHEQVERTIDNKFKEQNSCLLQQLQ